MSMTFGERFREIRVNGGYGLRAVADAVKCSGTYLSHIERNLNGNVASEKLAKALIYAVRATASEKKELLALLRSERCPTCGARVKPA